MKQYNKFLYSFAIAASATVASLVSLHDCLAQPEPAPTNEPALCGPASHTPIRVPEEVSQNRHITGSLINRIAPPPQHVVDTFVGAGMKEVRTHSLTDIERAKVENALASLPELHRKVLEEHLHTLGFLDGIPGEGTGLTSPSDHPGLLVKSKHYRRISHDISYH
jgi:hypothetical protein